MKKVLVALDDSDASRSAAAFVNRFFDRAEFEVLGLTVTDVAEPSMAEPGTRVVNPPVWPWQNRAMGGPEPTYAIDDPVTVAEQEGVDTLSAAGLEEADPLVEHGEVGDAIVRAAEEHDADLIVVGTRDRGVVSRVMFGSVSDDLIRHAPRPVLVVR